MQLLPVLRCSTALGYAALTQGYRYLTPSGVKPRSAFIRSRSDFIAEVFIVQN
jgi:hypothetical protein